MTLRTAEGARLFPLNNLIEDRYQARQILILLMDSGIAFLLGSTGITIVFTQDSLETDGKRRSSRFLSIPDSHGKRR